jgi:hypothetical protein
MPLTLQSVVIFKPISFTKAKFLASEFIKNKKLDFCKENTECFKFRAKAKNLFDEKTLISKTVIYNPGDLEHGIQINLILGKLIKN